LPQAGFEELGAFLQSDFGTSGASRDVYGEYPSSALFNCREDDGARLLNVECDYVGDYGCVIVRMVAGNDVGNDRRRCLGKGREKVDSTAIGGRQSLGLDAKGLGDESAGLGANGWPVIAAGLGEISTVAPVVRPPSEVFRNVGDPGGTVLQ